MRNNDQSLNADTFLLFKNTRMKLFIFIPVLFFSSVLLANFDYVEKTTCYAEHNSTTYIDGLCDLYFDESISLKAYYKKVTGKQIAVGFGHKSKAVHYLLDQTDRLLKGEVANKITSWN